MLSPYLGTSNIANRQAMTGSQADKGRQDGLATDVATYNDTPSFYTSCASSRSVINRTIRTLTAYFESFIRSLAHDNHYPTTPPSAKRTQCIPSAALPSQPSSPSAPSLLHMPAMMSQLRSLSALPFLRACPTSKRNARRGWKLPATTKEPLSAAGHLLMRSVRGVGSPITVGGIFLSPAPRIEG